MEYVLINAENHVYKKKDTFSPARYATLSAATAVCTRFNKVPGNTANWKPQSLEEYRACPVKMVQRVNLMSGETFLEAEDTPNFCSPASETYWSM